MTGEQAVEESAADSVGATAAGESAVGPDTAAPVSGGDDDAASAVESPSIAVQSAEFVSLEGQHRESTGTPLDRFYDVHVTVWAELGRVQVPLGELLKLGEGSVVRLERPVSAPVDLMAQGVRVARGEVVVVDDCFAIRIKELDARGKPGPP